MVFFCKLYGKYIYQIPLKQKPIKIIMKTPVQIIYNY